MFKQALIAVIILQVIAPIEDLRAEEEWNKTLRQQLQTEQSCVLNFITALREFEDKGHRVIEGRAHCGDQRKFDFVREKPGEKFTLKACQTTVC